MKDQGFALHRTADCRGDRRRAWRHRRALDAAGAGGGQRGQRDCVGALGQQRPDQLLIERRTGGQAVLLATLGTACAGSSQAFLSPDLAADPVVKSGYRFAMRRPQRRRLARPSCNGAATQSDFYTSATPLGVGVTGHRRFSDCRRRRSTRRTGMPAAGA